MRLTTLALSLIALAGLCLPARACDPVLATNFAATGCGGVQSNFVQSSFVQSGYGVGGVGAVGVVPSFGFATGVGVLPVGGVNVNVFGRGGFRGRFGGGAVVLPASNFGRGRVRFRGRARF